MIVSPKILNGSHDLTALISGCSIVHGLGLAMINLHTKFVFSISTNYEDMKGDTNVEYGVVLGS